MRQSLQIAGLALLVAACGGGEISWKPVIAEEGNAGLPTRPRWCPDGTLWLTGPRVLTRDFFGGWKQVDVCGEYATTAAGEARDIDLACLDGGRLVVLCGTDGGKGQVLLSYDAQKKGTPVVLPSDGTLRLAPMPDTVALVGDTTLYVLQDGALVDKGMHGLSNVQGAAGNGPDDVLVTAGGLSPESGMEQSIHRFDGTSWSEVARGNGHVMLRDNTVFALTSMQNGEGYAFRFRRGEAPFDLGAAQPKTTRPLVPIAVLPPDRLVYLAFFRTGFERENPSAYVWVGRPGASDVDYAGAAPMISGGGLYVAGSGGFVAAIDDGRFLVAGANALFEGAR